MIELQKKICFFVECETIVGYSLQKHDGLFTLLDPYSNSNIKMAIFSSFSYYKETDSDSNPNCP